MVEIFLSIWIFNRITEGLLVNFNRRQAGHRDFTVGLLNGLSAPNLDEFTRVPQPFSLTNLGSQGGTTTELFDILPALGNTMLLGFGIGNDL